MNRLWPFIITGLASGSLYGIAAMGLVLTYKTTGIFNFAHGAVAAAAAYCFYELRVKHNLPWPVALLVCVVGVGVILGTLLERVTRRLTTAPPAAKIVATVGILLIIQGTCTAVYGGANIPLQPFLPQRLFRVGGVNFTAEQVISFSIAAIAAAGLYGFFRFSRTGIAMRGVVDNPELLDLAGTSPVWVRTQAWTIGSAFAALSGVLLAPRLGLDAISLTLIVVQAFGAAALARFTSLPMAYAGGLVLGVAGSISTRYAADVPNLSNLPPALPFLVLFLVLVFTPKRRLVESNVFRRPSTSGEMAPALAWAGRAALLVGLIVVPHVVGARLPVYTNGIIFVLIFLSLRLLVRTSGQVSLCHAAFAAMGAAVFSHLTTGLGLPWAVALVGAALATVPVGAIVAIPAIRLSGVYLALATFGFGILMERLVYPTGLMFGGGIGGGIRKAPRPQLGDLDLTTDVRFYYVCLAVVVAATIGVLVLNRTRLGRLLQAMSDSPVALATQGTAVNTTRILVFCIAAFLAGLAGGLFAALSGSITGLGFNAFASISWLAVLALAGRGELSAAFLAAATLAVVPTYINNETYTELQPVLFGSFALLAALGQGRAFDVRSFFNRLKGSRGEEQGTVPSLPVVPSEAAPAAVRAGSQS